MESTIGTWFYRLKRNLWKWTFFSQSRPNSLIKVPMFLVILLLFFFFLCLLWEVDLSRQLASAAVLHKHLALEWSQEKINDVIWASCPTEQQQAPCPSRKLTSTPWRTNTQQEITFFFNSFVYEMIPGFFWPQWRSCQLTPSTFCSNPLALWVSCPVCVGTFHQSNKSGGTLFVPH